MKQFTVRAVGNAHIDMAWLWPWTETVEVVKDTFTTALQLMKEYPDFTYAQSSVQDFAWMQEKYPALFREIQQRVKEGRWELVGGMWVEPDLNMPDGESTGSPVARRQALVPALLQRRRQYRLESGFVWLHLAAPANLPEIRHRHVRNPKDVLEHAGILVAPDIRLSL